MNLRNFSWQRTEGFHNLREMEQPLQFDVPIFVMRKTQIQKAVCETAQMIKFCALDCRFSEMLEQRGKQGTSNPFRCKLERWRHGGRQHDPETEEPAQRRAPRTAIYVCGSSRSFEVLRSTEQDETK